MRESWRGPTVETPAEAKCPPGGAGVRLATTVWRHPVAAALVLMVLCAAQILLARPGPVDIGRAIVVQGYLALLGALALTVLGWWGITGFLKAPDRSTLGAFAPVMALPIVATVAVLLAGPSVKDPSLIAAGAVVYLLGAFGEEAIFRGAILQALLPRGVLIAAVGSTVVFAIQHVGSLLVGLPLADTLVQMLVVAPLVGFGFAALRISTGAIWPLIALHALINFPSYLVQGAVLNTAGNAVPDQLVWIGVLSLGESVLLPLYGALAPSATHALRPAATSTSSWTGRGCADHTRPSRPGFAGWACPAPTAARSRRWSPSSESVAVAR